jgi:hypothetical protein
MFWSYYINIIIRVCVQILVLRQFISIGLFKFSNVVLIKMLFLLLDSRIYSDNFQTPRPLGGGGRKESNFCRLSESSFY